MQVAAAQASGLASLIHKAQPSIHMNLFEAFDNITKAEWLAKVEKDLKGRAIEELDWQLEAQINLKPFYMAADAPKQDIPNYANNKWKISEDIIIYQLDIDALKSNNAQLLDALMNGVDAPTLIFNHSDQACTVETFRVLLEKVELNYISAHFKFQHMQDWQVFLQYLHQQQQLWTNIQGTGSFADYNNMDALANQIEQSQAVLPHFKLIHLDGTTHYNGKANTTNELAQMLSEAVAFFDALTERDVSVQAIQHHFYISMTVGVSFFASIAKIRAFKLLWMNLAKAYGIQKIIMPPIHIRTAIEPQMDAPEAQNTNMIRNTTQAMSAAIAGIKRLTVTPSDAHTGTTSAFTRRIARNIQHLLKFESHLDHVVDAANGSYYIEEMTQQIARIAWEKFTAHTGQTQSHFTNMFLY